VPIVKMHASKFFLRISRKKSLQGNRKKSFKKLEHFFKNYAFLKKIAWRKNFSLIFWKMKIFLLHALFTHSIFGIKFFLKNFIFLEKYTFSNSWKIIDYLLHYKNRIPIFHNFVPIFPSLWSMRENLNSWKITEKIGAIKNEYANENRFM
jgi:hypothetical protein